MYTFITTGGPIPPQRLRKVEKNNMIDLRKTFIETLMELAEKDPTIVLLVPDVGFNFLEQFQRRFPDRFFNTGVTEQSTMIMAAGLALSGMKPYVYSMINFVVFRPYEMVRNAVCYHNANVKLFGVKGSEKYKFLGFSHNIQMEMPVGNNDPIDKGQEYMDEDIYTLDKLPNMEWYVPTDEKKLKDFMLSEYNRVGPAYTRI